MNARRMTLALGAAAGGMLASAFLSTAVAFADTPDVTAPVTGEGTIGAPSTDSFTDVTSGPEQVTSLSGVAPYFQEESGTQLFNIDDATDVGGTTANPVPDVVGNFTLLENTGIAGGFTNSEGLVTALGTDNNSLLPVADVPTVGSITDVFSYSADPSDFTNTYTEIPGATSTAAPTVTDTLTLFGENYTIPTSFVASDVFPGTTEFGPFLTLATGPDIIGADIVSDLTSTSAQNLAVSIAGDLGQTITDAQALTYLTDIAALF